MTIAVEEWGGTAKRAGVQHGGSRIAFGIRHASSQDASLRLKSGYALDDAIRVSSKRSSCITAGFDVR
jgi:hypothetical protein